MTNFSTMRAEQLAAVDPNAGIILDVRTKMEHAEKHLGFGHAHVPLDALQPEDFMLRHGLDKDAGVYILCRSGKRATQAAEKFAAAGYRNVKVIEGGIIACEDCGHEVKGTGAGATPGMAARPQGPLSLERQVRIAAGLFAATGAALGLFVNPVFTVIPLFVGAGLIFAGVTDRCGMALMLTKAPWNKGAACATTGGGSCAVSSAFASGPASGPVGAKVGQSCQ